MIYCLGKSHYSCSLDFTTCIHMFSGTTSLIFFVFLSNWLEFTAHNLLQIKSSVCDVRIQGVTTLCSFSCDHGLVKTSLHICSDTVAMQSRSLERKVLFQFDWRTASMLCFCLRRQLGLDVIVYKPSKCSYWMIYMGYTMTLS